MKLLSNDLFNIENQKLNIKITNCGATEGLCPSPVIMSLSDSLVKKSDLFDATPTSFDSHSQLSGAYDKYKYTIEVVIKRLQGLRIWYSRVRVIARNLSRKTENYSLALCRHGEVLAIAAWNIWIFMDIIVQEIIIHTFSKHSVDIAYLLEVCLLYFGLS